MASALATGFEPRSEVTQAIGDPPRRQSDERWTGAGGAQPLQRGDADAAACRGLGGPELLVWQDVVSGGRVAWLHAGSSREGRFRGAVTTRRGQERSAPRSQAQARHLIPLSP